MVTRQDLSTGGADGAATPAGVRMLLTVPEAARALGIGRSSVYELVNRGELEVVHIGRSVRVPIDALVDFVVRLRSDRE